MFKNVMHLKQIYKYILKFVFHIHLFYHKLAKLKSVFNQKLTEGSNYK